MNGVNADLLQRLDDWLQQESSVCSAVLFGSQVRDSKSIAAADKWSDFDLHLVTTSLERIESTDWFCATKGARMCLKVMRPATGGARKLTLLFVEGEVDLVLVPAYEMHLALLAVRLGLHRRIRFVKQTLDVFTTIMNGGYRFLKGQRKWGPLYSRIIREMTGVRISDDEARRMADSFLCDMLWVLRKLERGELIAAQRILHRSLQETNIVLLHELRVRKGEPSFQQARRVEHLVAIDQLEFLRISARLDQGEITEATWLAFRGLDVLMRDLVPQWHVPISMLSLLDLHKVTPAR